MAKPKQLSCYDCGRIFVPQGKTYYLKEKHKYICPSCAKERKREKIKARTGMSQSYIAMILKIFFGIVFVSMAKGRSTALYIGIILILWGIVPFISRKR